MFPDCFNKIPLGANAHRDNGKRFDLVVRDAEGKVFTVRYEAVNAMLLNEFLKEHRTVQEQGATIAQLKSAVAKQEATGAQQQKQIEALTAGLQKVSAQIEVSKPAPKTVLNNQ
jgi:uncharacterized coiled-coil protein SlyX